MPQIVAPDSLLAKQKWFIKINGWFNKIISYQPLCIFGTLIKELFKGIWFVYTEIIFEPVFLGFSIFLIFNRFQDIVQYIISHPESKWWGVFANEMNTHLTLYSFFILVLFLWVMIKIIRALKDNKKDKDINDKLDNIIKLLKKHRRR